MTMDRVTPQKPATLISRVLFMFMPKIPAAAAAREAGADQVSAMEVLPVLCMHTLI